MPAVPETIPAPRFCRLVKLAATVAIDWLSNSTLLLASRKRTTSALLPAVAVVTSTTCVHPTIAAASLLSG